MERPTQGLENLLESSARHEVQEAATRVAERNGVEALAKEVRITKRAMHELLDSGRILPRNEMRLYAWYLRTSAESVTSGTAAVALEFLFKAFPPEQRIRSQLEFVRALAWIYRNAAAHVPDWLASWEARFARHFPEEDPPRGSHASVDLVAGHTIYVDGPASGADPRLWVAQRLAEHGVWKKDVFYPWHRIAQITFVD